MSAKSAIEEKLKEIGAPKKYSPLNPNETYIQRWDAELEEFSEDIEDYYDENRQTDEEKEQKLEILKEIEDYLVKKLFVQPINGIQYEVRAVVPFGSSASALGMAGGDLDMTICVHPPLGRKRTGEIKQRTNDILREIVKSIESGKMLNDREIEDMEHRDGARVPIINVLIDGVEVDISVSMTVLVSEQYLAAKMIDAYAKYDHRFILLAAFVKKWLKSKKTDNNEDYYRTVFPNSCCSVLLVVFFMKQYKLLPNLGARHPSLIENVSWVKARGGESGSFGIPNAEVKRWKDSNHCDVSLGTLFLLFLEYYANLDFMNYKLLVEEGELRHKRKAIFLSFRDAMEIVINTDVSEIEEELMEDVLPDVCSYSKTQLNKLRRQGLHFGKQPRKFEK
ncbi:hypothetical protein B9Z55_003445 [Caenorhabditis nigoni]|uniref:Poly(A) RNA polymerase mitochondrial-like central palm domain-containing protein n=2 Tax=Caenorhabditis nigoni TaxID=1611254 RepID=A0A2G5VQP1_9PELO|nr:hypothetical protein B9Z55_003445 [Caenorhabditis nigoni]